MTFVPQPVSRLYRNHWQYALDIARLPFLRPAALVISVMPILVETDLIDIDIPTGLWLIWGSAISFVLAWALLYFSCPKFIFEYRDYGQYLKRHHSHRWIVWEFYNNIDSLEGWKKIVKEVVFKELAEEDEGDVDQEPFSLCPDFPKPTNIDKIEVFRPVNHKRDIYLPFHCDGKRVVLPLREDDPKRPEKEKELFWILYSQAAKERPIRKGFYWLLIYSSALLFAFNVALNVKRTIS